MRMTVLAAALALAAAGCRCAECGTPEERPADSAGATPAAPAAAEIQSVTPSKDYPLEKCVVSGEELDEMGEPVAILYRGVEVQFCCRKCIAEFKKDPKKYLDMLEEAKARK